MSDFKKIKNEESIPNEIKDTSLNCLLCGESVENGGTWATSFNQESLITVCSKEKCKRDIIHWAIDTYISDKEGTKEKIKEEFIEFVKKNCNEKRELND